MPSAMDIVSHTKLGQLVLHMDEGKVYQVIRNLLSNAVHYADTVQNNDCYIIFNLLFAV